MQHRLGVMVRPSVHQSGRLKHTLRQDTRIRSGEIHYYALTSVLSILTIDQSSIYEANA